MPSSVQFSKFVSDMKREIYIKIKAFLREVIRGSEFEGHVMTVGGCVRDDLMGLEVNYPKAKDFWASGFVGGCLPK